MIKYLSYLYVITYSIQKIEFVTTHTNTNSNTNTNTII
jgi:hypothetical protein